MDTKCSPADHSDHFHHDFLGVDRDIKDPPRTESDGGRCNNCIYNGRFHIGTAILYRYLPTIVALVLSLFWN